MNTNPPPMHPLQIEAVTKIMDAINNITSIETVEINPRRSDVILTLDWDLGHPAVKACLRVFFDHVHRREPIVHRFVDIPGTPDSHFGRVCRDEYDRQLASTGIKRRDNRIYIDKKTHGRPA